MKRYLDIVNAAIAGIDYPAEPALLYQPIAYAMASGGKRLRPVLALMTCEALGGNIEDVLQPALGLEMYHNFTLLHDDVMDRADVRRGRPTVHARWNDNVAILSGDAMLTRATQLIAQAPERCALQVLDMFNEMAMQVYEGQQFDMDFESRNDVTVDEYMNMIEGKTAALLATSTAIGALVANADYVDVTCSYLMGQQLGMAFQLQDDMLDVWGNPATFGKEIGGDIMCGKKTFLLINAMQRATGEDRDVLLHYITGEGKDAPRDEKVPAVTAVYDRLNLQDIAKAEIDRCADDARAAVCALSCSDDARRPLMNLIDNVLMRDK